MEFKDVIKKARTKQGWTFKQMADYLGVNVSTVWQYEHGSNVKNLPQIISKIEKLGFVVNGVILCQHGEIEVPSTQLIKPKFNLIEL